MNVNVLPKAISKLNKSQATEFPHFQFRHLMSGVVYLNPFGISIAWLNTARRKRSNNG